MGHPRKPVILSEAKNLALVRSIAPQSQGQGEILRFAQNDRAVAIPQGFA
ncbi:MAG: hypothetical protein ABSE79_22490 [Terriglobia bacterium]|jgi:hypothetical protein